MSKTLKQVLADSEQFLKSHDIDEYVVDSWLLFEHIFQISRVDFILDRDNIADEQKVMSYQEAIKKRATHYPLQYIIGSQQFLDLEIKVNENVLIPRQDTEVLVETVSCYLKKDMHVLDMCTGSGCIILALASAQKLTRALGIDLSEKALLVANENKISNHIESVEFRQSNLFENVDGQFDIIVSNPPYIKTKEVETLMEEVKLHEPMMALDGLEDGLYFYREIIEKSVDFLHENGMIFFEIGCDQGKDVEALLKAYGYDQIVIKKDLAGLDRVVYAKKK